MKIDQPSMWDDCEAWPACRCVMACADEPRSRWAGPIIVLTCLAAWAIVIAGIWLALSVSDADASLLVMAVVK